MTLAQGGMANDRTSSSLPWTTARTRTPITLFDEAAGQVIDLLDIVAHHRSGRSAGCPWRLPDICPASTRRRYFRGMVLADIADRPNNRGEGRPTAMLALVAEKGPAGVADEMMPKLLRAGNDRRSRTCRACTSARAGPTAGSDCGRHCTASMTRSDSTALLSDIHCPNPIIVGENDTLNAARVEPRRHAAAISGAEAKVDGDDEVAASLARRIYYVAGELDDPALYERIKARLDGDRRRRRRPALPGHPAGRLPDGDQRGWAKRACRRPRRRPGAASSSRSRSAPTWPARAR